MPADKSFLGTIVMPLLVMEQTILPKRYRIIETCNKNNADLLQANNACQVKK